MSVRLEIDGDVGIIILASAERRNALSRDIVGGVLDALRASAAASVRAIVLAGEGPAFCAGADIGDLLGAGWIDGAKQCPDPIDLFEAISRDSRMVIAAVDGMALGGGFELAMSCDLAVASQDAVFALPELSHGVIPNSALWRLGRLVGPRVTLELAVTGRRMAAQEAAALRLVTAVVPAGTARAAATAMAAGFVRRAPPGALAALKRGLAAAAPVDWPGVRQALQQIPSAEWREGLTAFAERRQPDYEQYWSNDAHRQAIQDL